MARAEQTTEENGRCVFLTRRFVVRHVNLLCTSRLVRISRFLNFRCNAGSYTIHNEIIEFLQLQPFLLLLILVS